MKKTLKNTNAISNINPGVDEYINKSEKWQIETKKLRKIILDCNLYEDLKWGKPCYIFQGKNIVLIQGFKEYCALLFFKGALLQDVNSILVKMGDNTQAGRQIRFTNISEIVKLEPVMKKYIYEAIEIEKKGLKVDFKENIKLIIPEEFKNKLNKNSELKIAFNLLTPGRQRAYIIYFSAPKQPKTREARIEKYMQKILGGKGLND